MHVQLYRMAAKEGQGAKEGPTVLLHACVSSCVACMPPPGLCRARQLAEENKEEITEERNGALEEEARSAEAETAAGAGVEEALDPEGDVQPEPSALKDFERINYNSRRGDSQRCPPEVLQRRISGLKSHPSVADATQAWWR